MSTTTTLSSRFAVRPTIGRYAPRGFRVVDTVGCYTESVHDTETAAIKAANVLNEHEQEASIARAGADLEWLRQTTNQVPASVALVSDAHNPAADKGWR